MKEQMNKKARTGYSYNNLKSFSEFRVSELMANNIIEVGTQCKNLRLLHQVAKCKLRKMYVFGFAHALYLQDKKKNKIWINRLFEQLDQLDMPVINNLNQNIKELK